MAQLILNLSQSLSHNLNLSQSLSHNLNLSHNLILSHNLSQEQRLILQEQHTPLATLSVMLVHYINVQ
jgi:hypothetical protein